MADALNIIPTPFSFVEGFLQILANVLTRSVDLICLEGYVWIAEYPCLTVVNNVRVV